MRLGHSQSLGAFANASSLKWDCFAKQGVVRSLTFHWCFSFPKLRHKCFRLNKIFIRTSLVGQQWMHWQVQTNIYVSWVCVFLISVVTGPTVFNDMLRGKDYREDKIWHFGKSPCSGRHVLLLAGMFITALIHEGTICLSSFWNHFNHIWTVFGDKGCIGLEVGM